MVRIPPGFSRVAVSGDPNSAANCSDQAAYHHVVLSKIDTIRLIVLGVCMLCLRTHTARCLKKELIQPVSNLIPLDFLEFSSF